MNDAQAKYLVHVKPPGDLLVDSIRKVIDESNITNAAIVFDNFFGKILMAMARVFVILFPTIHLNADE